MKEFLEVYRSLNFDGCVYAKLHTEQPVQLITYSLYDDDGLVGKKSTHGANITVDFTEISAKKIKVVAEVLDAERSSRILSRELNIKVQPGLFKTLYSLPKKSKVIDALRYCDKIVHYFLEIQFKTNGQHNFYNEIDATTPLFANFKQRHLAESARSNRAAVVPVFADVEQTTLENQQLAHLYQLIASGSFGELKLIAEELETLDYVESCSLMPDTRDQQPPALLDDPTIDRATEKLVEGRARSSVGTPDFSHLQTYLDEGRGMNVRAAWRAGETGRYGKLHFLDYGVYRNHEDLQGNINVVNSRSETQDCNHGTASTGCIMSKNNAFGMTGIAHDCDFNFYDTDDFDLIVRNAQPGDIVAIDSQLSSGGWLVPMTFSQGYWNRINTLSRKGVVVILAAGNGNNNLSPQAGIMPDYGDSGAMLVGAVSSTTGRRLYFSNYNDVTSLICSWGERVATTGYGNLQQLPGNNHNYTSTYSGTSSATPLVAGALVLIQSYAKRKYGVYLNGLEMRDMIAQTGRKEGVGDGVGCRPDVMAAFAWLDANLGDSQDGSQDGSHDGQDSDHDGQHDGNNDIMPIAQMRIKAPAGSEMRFTVLLPEGVNTDAVNYQWRSLAREHLDTPQQRSTKVRFPEVERDTISQISVSLTGAYQASPVNGLLIVPAAKDEQQDDNDSGNDASLYPLWAANRAYAGGDRVSHKGSNYLAKWWIAPGVEPGLEMNTGAASGDSRPWTKI